AATWSFSTLAVLSIWRASIHFRQSCSATKPPVIEAVRVPPSAWMTSQSTVICTSPSACRSTTARSERPIRRWISSVRPPCLPDDASRRMRSPVERGSMPYSAVTQPLPELRSQDGTRSSRLAVHSTWVSPKRTRQEPSACLETLHSKEIARISSGWRLDGRMVKILFDVSRLVTAPRSGRNARASTLLCVAPPRHYINGLKEPEKRDDKTVGRSAIAVARRTLARDLPDDRRVLSA